MIFMFFGNVPEKNKSALGLSDRIKMSPEHINCNFFCTFRTLKNHLRGVEMIVFLINPRFCIFFHIKHHDKVNSPGRMKLSIKTDLQYA